MISKAVAFVQAANPNAIGNGLEETINGLKKEQLNSPGKSKNKLGALYNPNYVDPRALPPQHDDGGPAGVQTNYGVKVLNTIGQRKFVDAEGKQLNPYYNNIRDDDNYILAQGAGTGTFNPGNVAKLKGHTFDANQYTQNNYTQPSSLNGYAG